jgi:hypothetical protein
MPRTGVTGIAFQPRHRLALSSDMTHNYGHVTFGLRQSSIESRNTFLEPLEVLAADALIRLPR